MPYKCKLLKKNASISTCYYPFILGALTKLWDLNYEYR